RPAFGGRGTRAAIAGGDRVPAIGRWRRGGACLSREAFPSLERPMSAVAAPTSCAIDDALVLTENGVAAGTGLVEGRQGAAVAFPRAEREALRVRAASLVAADGHWLIPGLVDGHAHGYATLLRGTENSRPLELWSFYTVLYGRRFDSAAMRAAILLGAA